MSLQELHKYPELKRQYERELEKAKTSGCGGGCGNTEIVRAKYAKLLSVRVSRDKSY